MMTPPGKVSAKRNYPVVDTCLRRSSRVKQVSGGFKKDTCSDRRCLACTPNPPTLSTQVIRKLGKELCQLEEEDLSDEVLLTKKEQTSTVGRKKSGSTKKKRSNGYGPEKRRNIMMIATIEVGGSPLAGLSYDSSLFCIKSSSSSRFSCLCNVSMLLGNYEFCISVTALKWLCDCLVIRMEQIWIMLLAVNLCLLYSVFFVMLKIPARCLWPRYCLITNLTL